VPGFRRAKGRAWKGGIIPGKTEKTTHEGRQRESDYGRLGRQTGVRSRKSITVSRQNGNCWSGETNGLLEKRREKETTNFKESYVKLAKHRRHAGGATGIIKKYRTGAQRGI